MPELPEVECVVRALAPNLTGRSIKSVAMLSRSSAQGSPRRLETLAGRRIETLSRRGKFILAELTGGWRLAVHLRMTGWLGLRTRSAWNAHPDKFVRVLFVLDGGPGSSQDLLLFRDIRKFGRLWCGSAADLAALPSIAKLGPEPLEIGVEEFSVRLRARRGRLKSILLDQSFVAGVGNIYADESLYRAQLHPLAKPQAISRQAAARLHQSIQTVLRKAIAAGGSSIGDYLHPDGTPGWFQRALRAYGREGKPCGRCKTAIRRIVVGQRGTWFCPACQRRKTSRC